MSHVDGVDDGVGYAVRGRSKSSYGVEGFSDSYIGVGGYSDIGYGVSGLSSNGIGVDGYSNNNTGVRGWSYSGIGVLGRSHNHSGVYGVSDKSIGVEGFSDSYIAVYGLSYKGIGLYGESDSSYGVWGYSPIGTGVVGRAFSGDGVYGDSDSGYGVYGLSVSNYGVSGSSSSSNGVYGRSSSSNGVYGSSDSGTGLYGESDSSYAAYLNGRVYIRGPLEKPGGQFKIDHPLDPANKYLCHSFVESPDMKNVYDGVAALDNKGEAEIELPDWFGALNKDFRYQLTAIGAPGPNLYVAEEIISDTTKPGSHDNDEYDSSNDDNNNGNRFKIAGGTPGMKVSWQVTGIRKDPWANAHRVQVEEDKPDKERGYYIYPELYGQPEENGISHLLFPEKQKQELLINEIKPNL